MLVRPGKGSSSDSSRLQAGVAEEPATGGAPRGGEPSTTISTSSPCRVAAHSYSQQFCLHSAASVCRAKIGVLRGSFAHPSRHHPAAGWPSQPPLTCTHVWRILSWPVLHALSQCCFHLRRLRSCALLGCIACPLLCLIRSFVIILQRWVTL